MGEREGMGAKRRGWAGWNGGGGMVGPQLGPRTIFLMPVVYLRPANPLYFFTSYTADTAQSRPIRLPMIVPFEAKKLHRFICNLSELYLLLYLQFLAQILIYFNKFPVIRYISYAL